jgi:hypothetical protein
MELTKEQEQQSQSFMETAMESAIAYGKELSEGDDINAFVQELIDNGVPLGAMVEEIN